MKQGRAKNPRKKVSRIDPQPAFKSRRQKIKGTMSAAALRNLMMDHFKAHAIKGELKPSRTYEVVEKSPTQMRIRTRGKNKSRVQLLSADLVSCKSLRYGQFRRVDLFWGVERKEMETDSRPHRSCSASENSDAHSVAMPEPEFTAGGDPVPVDTFISRGLGLSSRSRKEKSS